jgi:hypothetical protein
MRQQQPRQAAALAAEQSITPGISLDDFHAYMPQHSYIYTPSREPWPAGSVDARLPSMPLLDPRGAPVLDKKGNPKTIRPSTWLDKNRPVEQMTWAPGEPLLIRDLLISDGGWIERKGVTCFNLYRPPVIKPGDATRAQFWIDHTCSSRSSMRSVPGTSRRSHLNTCSGGSTGT